MRKAILLFLCLLILGCDTFLSKKDTPTTANKTPAIKGVLLARVNDWALGTGDLREQLKAVRTLDPNVDINDIDFKKKFLQELVNIEILAQEAKNRRLDKDQEVIDAVENFRRTLLAQKIMGNIIREITVTDAEIKSFYETNKQGLRLPEKRKIREIVVSTEMLAKDMLIRLLQGENFSSLARSYSMADSKDKGGDLGYLSPEPKERFEKFWQEAFTKDKGSITSYFKGPKGYYILKVEDIKGGKVTPLKEVKDRIKDHLRREKINKKREDVIYNAKQRMKIIINDALLD